MQGKDSIEAHGHNLRLPQHILGELAEHVDHQQHEEGKEQQRFIVPLGQILLLIPADEDKVEEQTPPPSSKS